MLENSFTTRDKPIQIWPNPCYDYLNLSADANIIKKIAIYNLQGQMIYQSNEMTDIYQIDVSNWMPGVYIIQSISEDNITSTQKIIVK